MKMAKHYIPAGMFIWILLVAFHARGAVYTVTNAGDAVTGGTLRWAITQANAVPGPHTIQFSLPPPYTISPTAELPHLTNHNIRIDGGNYPPRIAVDGSGAGYVTGLRLSSVTNSIIEKLKIINYERSALYLLGANDCIVRGCMVSGNDGNGIEVIGNNNTIGGTNATDGNLIYSNMFYNLRLGGNLSSGNLVYGNKIGTDAAGTNQYPGGLGIMIDGPKDSRVGGARTGQGNVIMTGGRCFWILGTNTTGTRVQGNKLGTDVNGMRTFPATDYCIYLDDVTDTMIGGLKPGEGNIIAGYSYGIYLSGTGSMYNFVGGNLIGVGADGTTILSNGTAGIEISRAANNIIGSPGDGRNVIGGSQNGIMVRFSEAVSNQIVGNYIGVGDDGLTPTPNTAYNIYVFDAPGTIIGGTNLLEGNVLSGCPSTSLFIQNSGSSNSQVLGNFIGTDATGMIVVSNRFSGMNVQSANNLIGWNLIAGNGSSGISLTTSNAVGNRIFGNRIGVDATGTNALPNSGGIYLSAAVSNRIGGVGANEGNVISGNHEDGIHLTFGARGNVIENNRIGTDASGLLALGNGEDGVQFNTSVCYNELGASAAAPNLIGNNGRYGVYLFFTTGNVIRANYIGTNGEDEHPNGDDGVHANETEGTEISGNVISAHPDNGLYAFRARGFRVYTNRIGISAIGLPMSNAVSGVHLWQSSNGRMIGNIIAANGQYGVYSRDCDHTEYLGNYIGTDTNGTAAMGNMLDGLYIYGGVSNRFGAAGSAHNVISGNGGSGLFIDGGPGHHTIQGNRIGVDLNGQFAIPNAGIGLCLNALPENLVGGGGAGEGNIISGNGSYGIEMAGVEAARNRVVGNLIGTDATATQPIGNGAHGVYLFINAASNIVGGATAAERNIIAFNGGAGVVVGRNTSEAGTVRNQIVGNRIFMNNGLGIDLAEDGVTHNDTLDPDNGPNRLQNFPVIALASNNGAQIRIEGYLESLPSSTFLLHFFGNAQVNPSGYGEGETILGSAFVSLPAGGMVGFTNTFAAPVFPPNFLTATATLIDGLYGETSEFSRRFVMDADSDGMADGYEQLYFGSITGGDPSADLDGDQVSNLGEFLADTQPDNGADYPRITAMSGTGSVVQITGAPHSAYRQYSLLAADALLPDPPAWSTRVSTLERQGGVYTLSADIPPASTTLVYGINANVP
ncbi:MAG: hypothetical protein EOM20_03475 [Spartobacteria bacterium]|nr:hypothetical protein [Spartobacteria bacterium]